MFVSDSTKPPVVTESNIPILKRETSKKSKGANKLPQLQKYIETIVKASHEPRPKTPAGKKATNNEKPSAKVVENENKQTDVPEEKTKGEEDDSVLSMEIEKFLQKLYPNPYDLEKVNEFRDLIAAKKRSMDEENVIITADIEIKEDSSVQADSDNCVVSFSFKDSEDDSSSRVSDCSGRNLSTVWIESLRKSLDKEVQEEVEIKPEEWEIENKKLYQPNELDDLRRIYDMMDKATESFRALSSRSQKASENAKKNNRLVQFLSESNLNNTGVRKEAKKPKDNVSVAGSVERLDRRKHEARKVRPKSGNKNAPKKEEPQKVETSPKDNCRRSVSVDEVKNKEEEKEVSETSQKIDEVLEFMYSCLLKFNEGGEKVEDSQKQVVDTVGDVDAHVETSGEEVQTVETQNELGSYTEEVVVASDDTRLPRTVLPLSAKRKRKDDSYEVIKKALETEEKLLASECSRKSVALTRREVFTTPRLPELTLLEEIQKRSFVICVNSLPRSLRTMNPSTMAVSSLSISLSDTDWGVKELSHQKFRVEELCIARPPLYKPSCWTYRKEEGDMLFANITQVFWVRSSWSFRMVLTTTKETLVERSECAISWTEHTPRPVHDIQEALEETEECVYHLEHSYPNGDLEDPDNDKKKVHDLLLRTYNLQTKLHQYLHKMNCEPSTPRQMIDKGVSCEDKTDTSETDEKVRDSMVYWFLESSTISQKSREVLSDAKVDHATSYHAQVDDQCCQTGADDNDDRSSNYSFKSSNDFSECDFANKHEQPRSGRDVKLLQKIFNEIELYKNGGQKTEDAEEPNDTRLVEYETDPKPPAKVLKTVFKGKDSMTELTIGLKDVPMTHVSNISVEKKKYSENHTKISICISKDQPDTFDTRPSLSQIEDTSSKPESDDDDFQSVASTLSNPDTKPVAPEPKKTPKHRFEFYQKMDTEEKKAPTYAVCRYKALEPLRQALTDMQMKMRSIRRDSYYNSNEYYRRALKLAKMSAGFCQSCGNRAVIPEDTFGCYRSVLPRRNSSHKRSCYLGTTVPSSSFYSFRTSGGEVTDHYYDVTGSSYLLNSHPRSSRSFVKNSLHDMPVIFGRI